MTDVAYTLLFDLDPPKTTAAEFKALLEKPKDEVKIDAMKRLLVAMLDGNAMPELLMHVIRYVMPVKNKTLKKLLYVYWEIVPKRDAQGKLKSEMILVCNAIRNDLQHPNEYVRGNTLRFLTKLKEPELLEPLMPTVIACLEHRHLYVRKNCIFALDLIFRLDPDLVPDAPEMLANLLAVEIDPICTRNCFIVLGLLNREAALLFIQDRLDTLQLVDPLLQLAFVEFVRKDLKLASLQLKQQYLNLVADLLDLKSPAVVYEAALTLTLLSRNDESVLEAGRRFISLAISQSDNSVKLTCLLQIAQLSARSPGLFRDSVLDLLRILSSPDLDVKQTTLKLVLGLVDLKNVEHVVHFFKKELVRALSDDAESSADHSAEYKQLVIQTINSISLQYVDALMEVVDLMLDLLPRLQSQAAYDVVVFVKDVIEKFPQKREYVLAKLVSALAGSRSGKVLRGALWVLGQYAVTEHNVRDLWKFIHKNIGQLPILKEESDSQEDAAEQESSEEQTSAKKSHAPVVLPDGTYATENALTAEKPRDEPSEPSLRALILKGDYFLALVLALTLLKLVLRFAELSQDKRVLNMLKAEAALVMVLILRAGVLDKVSEKIDEDSAERISAYLRFLVEDHPQDQGEEIIREALLRDTRAAFEQHARSTGPVLPQTKTITRPDEALHFRMFPKSTPVAFDDEEDLAGAAKAPEKLSLRLSKIIPLTGFSDPVYAEGYVKVHQFDVVLDVLIVNQTATTLRNLSVEFATLGDLKVVDKPLSANVPPHGFHRVSTTVKVTSADTGVIFGNILYDGAHATDQTIVILNDVHIDIMDYIKPATCTETEFRKMWNEFEWENKIVVKLSSMETLLEYLAMLLKSTNMRCLTPGAVIGDDKCQFLSANLYLKLSFGEGVLANVCIEKIKQGPILGHVRVRSKGQGLALSLGDRVALVARKLG